MRLASFEECCELGKSSSSILSNNNNNIYIDVLFPKLTKSWQVKPLSFEKCFLLGGPCYRTKRA